MQIYYLDSTNLHFKPPENSFSQGNIAIGGNLKIQTILQAYNSGYFPWYSPGEKIKWWFTSPRYVLYPHDLKISKSMRPILRSKEWQLKIDTSFEQVVINCALIPRQGQGGSWISQEIVDAYTNLHNQGIAHSFEVWKSEHLIGGFYGIAIGSTFYGESMFSHYTNSSKYAFIIGTKLMEAHGIKLIDCQQGTQHLISLGAKGISGFKFYNSIQEFNQISLKQKNWAKWTSKVEKIKSEILPKIN